MSQRLSHTTNHRRLRFVKVIVGIVATIALLWQFENFRGKRNWESAVAKATAHGASLDLHDYIPQGVAAEDNAAEHPYFSISRTSRWSRDFRPLERQFSSALPPELFSGEFDGDLQRWQKHLRESDRVQWRSSDWATAEEDVLEGTQSIENDIQQIAEAFSLPSCHWFPLHEQMSGDLPRIGQISCFTSFALPLLRTSTMRSVSHLRLGDTNAARKESLGAIRLALSMSEDKSIIGFLIGAAISQDTVDSLSLLLEQENWSGSDLLAIQETLEPIDYLSHLNQALTRERAGTIYGYDQMHLYSPNALTGGKTIYRLNNFLRRGPMGWRLQVKASILERWDQQNSVDFLDHRRRLITNKTSVNMQRTKLDRFVSQFSISDHVVPRISTEGLLKKAARAQGNIDLCILQCALKRFSH